MRTFATLLSAFAQLAALSASGEDIQPLSLTLSQSVDLKQDTFLSHNRSIFDFEGEPAWIVEPEKPKPGRQWMWIMKWPGHDAEQTGQLDLLKRGYYYVYLEDSRYWMNAQGLDRAQRFYGFLTKTLHFNSLCNIIGTSWGGFYAIRYAAKFPDSVNKIYLDCPLLTFGKFKPWSIDGVAQAWPNTSMKNWREDPEMPINMAPAIALAGIPVLLLYGGKDTTVAPDENAELFCSRLIKAGGEITVLHRPMLGHRPRGFQNPKDYHRIVDFFESSQSLRSDNLGITK